MAPIGQVSAFKPQASNPFMQRVQGPAKASPQPQQPQGPGAGAGIGGGSKVGLGKQSPLLAKAEGGPGPGQNSLLRPSRQNGGVMPTMGGQSKVGTKMDMIG